jgi:hypothetical protein
MTDAHVAQLPAKPAGADTRTLTIAGAPCLLREHPREASRRVTILLRRGMPEQNRPWLGTAGTVGPVMILGIDPWATFQVSYESAADELIEALELRGHPGEVALAGAGLGSFAAIMLAANLAGRLAPMAVKVAAFSLVAQVHRTQRGSEIFHPSVGHGIRNKPDSLAGLRKYPALRPVLDQAGATGLNLKVKVFGTPLALLEWQQYLMIDEAPGVTHEEVLADDLNQDMMSWLMLLPNDAAASRDRLIRWTQARNPGWAPRVVEAKVDRELPVALAWRKANMSLAAIFDKI